jgi:5-methylcytosine-specific restriction enzyme subunit McrC
VRFDEYTLDIVENRILVAAIRRLLRLPGVPAATRGRLHQLARALADVPPLTAGLPVPPTVSNRLTARYQPALRLARLILANAGVEHLSGTVEANGIAFDLNRVFEDWLTTALREAVEPVYGGRIIGQYHTHLDAERRMYIRPDITWWDGRRCRAVVDAKYKDPSGDEPARADLYQVLAYCTRLGARHGHLVYGGDRGRTTYHVLGSGVAVTVHRVDLSAPLDDLRAQIATIAAAVAGVRPARDGDLRANAAPSPT